ncbi:zinc ribbon domain-containing protein, partial [Methanoregula sp. PtaU1.Bin006]
EVAGFLLILFVILPLAWWTTSRNIACAHADPASACSEKQRDAAALAAMTSGTLPGRDPGTGSQPPASPAPRPARPVCTNCGMPVKPGMRFCEQCGKEI